MPQSAVNAFAKNRAEELGPDLWRKFVVPLFFHKLALDDVRKPLLIEGGRGCGKTTLLRYLSHRTQLSERRQLSADRLPKQIGLYLRADTQYLRTYRGDWQEPDKWEKVFEHSLCLMILGELLSAFQMLALGPDRCALFPGIQGLALGSLQDFDPEAPANVDEAIRFVEKRQNQLAMWLNNPDDCARPLFLPMKPLLLALIRSARLQVPTIAGVDFFVFIDEYENLLDYQMRQINTFLKHSEPPLIFHVAAKRNGMSTRHTVGNEQLQEPDDYRRVDVEELLSEDFNLFAAELFCFRLLRKGISLGNSPVTEELLCDEQSVGKRLGNKEYREAVESFAGSILPGLSSEEMALHVFDDDPLRNRLKKSIEEVLRTIDRTVSSESFLRRDAAQASLCVPALLSQGKKPAEILKELNKYAAKQPSNFSPGEWIHHYFLGSLLSLYLPLQRPCIAYAGFSSFLKLARGNIRHFLELCHLSMQVLGEEETTVIRPIPPEKQAEAARMASALFVKETQGSGDHGNRLFLVVSTLGQIFRLSQHRPAQSESERTHFSIVNGALSKDADDILRECVKWSVFFATEETKVKDLRFKGEEYLLNPIYAPFFGISYNKGRRLELPAQSVEDIFVGARSSLDKLVKSFQDKWDITDSQIPLL